MFCRIRVRADRGHASSSSNSRPARSCPVCRRSMPFQNGTRRDGLHRHAVLRRQGPDLRAGRGRAVHDQPAPAARLVSITAAATSMFNEFLAKYNVIGFPCGNTGMQWGGWFRKEIKSAADLQGPEDAHRRARRARRRARRRRAAADRAGRHLSGARARRDRRGRVHRPLRRREARLQQGREVLLYARLAGGRDACSTPCANTEKWNALPPLYKKAVEVAAQATTTTMLAHYDTKNPEALLRLVAAGVDRLALPAAR